MSASETNGSTTPAWLIAIRPSRSTRTVRGISLNGVNQQEANDKHDMEATVRVSGDSRLFKGERTSHIYAEATSNTRHWASRDTTSSGTRIINDLSHDACSFRPSLSLSPVFAASV
jgi:hypothetical protein